MGLYLDANLKMDGCMEIVYTIIVVLISLCLLVSFQILFFCLITPFILIALLCPYFFDNILMFLNMGDTGE